MLCTGRFQAGAAFCFLLIDHLEHVEKFQSREIKFHFATGHGKGNSGLVRKMQYLCAGSAL
jgi:hypothetical protein